MTAAAPELPRAPQLGDDEHDDVVVLRGVSWADYQRLLKVRGDGPVPRFAYLEGVLEIMAPSRLHESVKSMVGRLVEAWCTEKGIDITPYGSWTLEKKKVKSAVEPDECFVLGDDPEDVPRPHLAIEVALGRSAVRKLDIYARLGVREVWTWRKKEGFLISVLGSGGYETRTESEVLPGIDLALLLRFVEVRPMTKAVRAYREALRA